MLRIEESNMKKFVSILLCMAILLSLCACGSNITVSTVSGTAKQPTAANDTQTNTVEPTAEPVEEVRETQTKDTSEGKVVFYNFDERIDAALQSLAEGFTKETGTKVTVKTIADNYDEELTAAFDSSEAPTIFSADKSNISKWKISCLDLSGTKAEAVTAASDLNCIDGEKLLALAYDYECFGVGVNTIALAGTNHYLDEISNWDSFSSVVAQVQQHYYNTKLTAAFAEPALSGDMWRYTCYMTAPVIFFECQESGITEQPAYLRADFMDNMRYFYELWYSNTPSARWYLDGVELSVPKSNFSSGKAAFYPCGSWEISTFVNDFGANAADFSMIPMYMGIRNEEEYGPCAGRAKYWCVNREVSENDIEASLNFIEYIAAHADELAKICAMPFDGVVCENPFLAAANNYYARGFKHVEFVNDYIPGIDWENNMFYWLIKYTTGYGDWVQMSDSFILGWTDAYELQHKY